VKHLSRIALGVVVAVLAVAACSSHEQAGSNASSPPAAEPSPLVTPYVGIEKMYKAYLKSRNKRVLIVSLSAVPRGADLAAHADSAYEGIKGSLEQSDVDIAVIKIPTIRSAAATGDAVFVYERDSKGVWSRVQDPDLIGAINRAGF
jgi:hypothetical protein